MLAKPTIFAADTSGKVERTWLEATITRADGTVEHLGIIADSHWTFPLRQFAKRILSPLTRLFGKAR